jgi:hypothetical protein
MFKKQAEKSSGSSQPQSLGANFTMKRLRSKSPDRVDLTLDEEEPLPKKFKQEDKDYDVKKGLVQPTPQKVPATTIALGSRINCS